MAISEKAQPSTFEDEQTFVSEQSECEQAFTSIFRPKSSSEVLFNACTKFYPDGCGGWYPVKRIVFNRLIYNPSKLERHLDRIFDDVAPDRDQTEECTKNRNDAQTFWKKSWYRARQQCYDYLMCNPDLDVFCTFTVDPKSHNSYSYDELVGRLSVWLDNRVRRHDLKYILVPERHLSGAIHFHGITNRTGLRLVPSGYWKVGKYTLEWEKIAKSRRNEAQEIFNVSDLKLGFSTAVIIEGECAQEKVSKYIWKYMTKQGGQKIGGRFYLHGGDLQKPRLEYSNEYFSEADGVLVSYGSTSCKIDTLN